MHGATAKKKSEISFLPLKLAILEHASSNKTR